MNRDPMNKYRATFRKMNGEITKDTHNGLSAWAYRNILANKKSPTADAELAALEDWEWETRMRIREVAALERIAAALEHDDTPQPEAAQVMQGVGLDPDATVDGVEFSDDITTELLSPDGPMQTSFIRLTVDELGFGAEVRSIDSGPVTAYADATAEWEFHNPDELESLAEFFQTKMPEALRALAATWRQQIAAGTIPAAEA